MPVLYNNQLSCISVKHSALQLTYIGVNCSKHVIPTPLVDGVYGRGGVGTTHDWEAGQYLLYNTAVGVQRTAQVCGGRGVFVSALASVDEDEMTKS